MLFSRMVPFVIGDKILQQPCGSSWCLTTCIDIAAAYAFFKQTNVIPEIAPVTCIFGEDEEEEMPKRRPPALSSEKAAKKKKPPKRFKSTINILKGGMNDEKHPAIEEKWDVGLEMVALNDITLNSVIATIAKINKVSHNILKFKDEGRISSEGNPERIIDFFCSINSGKSNESQKDRGICILEFRNTVGHSHACIVNGFEIIEGVKYLNVYNPEISYLPFGKYIDERTGVKYKIPGTKLICPSFRTEVSSLNTRLKVNELMYGDSHKKSFKSKYSLNQAILFSF